MFVFIFGINHHFIPTCRMFHITCAYIVSLRPHKEINDKPDPEFSAERADELMY